MYEALAEVVAERLETLLRERLGHGPGPIALHEPLFEGLEESYVSDCISSGWVSSVGAYVERFEKQVARACGADHGIAAVNGTTALHLALYELGLGPGDAVLVPALTFVATASAVIHAGGQPFFVDIERESLGIDPERLEHFFSRHCRRTQKGLVHGPSGLVIRALLPVHMLGHPAPMPALLTLAKRYGLPLIEDAAEALGSRVEGRACGALGRVGMISFNGNKTVTTGGGGMLVTNDAELAAHLKHLSTTAKRADGPFDVLHDRIGFNDRLPNLNAALGCAQMEQLEGFLARKRVLAGLYAESLDALDEGLFFREASWAQSNHWLNGIFFRDRTQRDAFLYAAATRGLQARPCWHPLSSLPPYRHAPRVEDLSVAEQVSATLAHLPSGPGLVPEEMTDP